MKRFLETIEIAFSYFSILPVRRGALLPVPDAAALAALPLVGATIGALSGTAAWLVSRVAPQSYVVATAFAAPIVLSGALHIDGFLDCSDAVFASVSPERRLEIMSDSHHGTYAVTAMSLLGALWLAALVDCRPSRLPALLAYSGALARLSGVASAMGYPDARSPTRSRAFASQPVRLWLALEIAVALASARFVARGLWPIVPVALLSTAIVARRIDARLGGGLTGDAYGFLIVFIEPWIVAVAARSNRN